MVLLEHGRALSDGAAQVENSAYAPVGGQVQVVHQSMVQFVHVVAPLVEHPGAVIEDIARQVVAAIATRLQVDVLACRLRNLKARIHMQSVRICAFRLGQA